MLPPRLAVAAFERLGIGAFTTTRAAGDFNLSAVGEVEREAARTRWVGLQQALVGVSVPRLASARQVHGTTVLLHDRPFEGWVRLEGADGHIVVGVGAAAVTVADCVPAFIAHPRGLVGIVHAGWRGVAGGILPEALRAFTRLGFPAHECYVHLGPSICGRCYEVGPEVYQQLTGTNSEGPRPVNLHALLADQATRLGVREVSRDHVCTQCTNAEFFSHRAGDVERQIACIYLRAAA
jgi:YfiH family protein